jgi:hypothetical protein
MLRDMISASLARWGPPSAAAPAPGENLATPPAPPAPYIDPQGEDADKQLLEVFYRQMGRGLEVHPETLLRGIGGVRAFQFASSSSRLAPADVQRIIEALDFCIGDSDRRANSGNHHRLRQRLKRMIATLPSPTTPPVSEPGEVGELDDEHRAAVRQAVAEALGSGAYDCTRVWGAWQVGTMGEDDFVLVAEDDDRVAEIADAAIEAIRAIALPAPGPVSECPHCGYEGEMVPVPQAGEVEA